MGSASVGLGPGVAVKDRVGMRQWRGGRTGWWPTSSRRRRRLSEIGRSRFVKRSVEGAGWPAKCRSGAPHTVLDEHVVAVIVKTLTEKAADATHGSTRALAKSLGISQPTVARIWKALGLKPWQTETFKLLSTNALFVGKVKDIVALYVNPPDHAVVVRVRRKRGNAAFDRTQPVLPDAARHPRATTMSGTALSISTSR